MVQDMQTLADDLVGIIGALDRYDIHDIVGHLKRGGDESGPRWRLGTAIQRVASLAAKVSVAPAKPSNTPEIRSVADEALVTMATEERCVFVDGAGDDILAFLEAVIAKARADGAAQERASRALAEIELHEAVRAVGAASSAEAEGRPVEDVARALRVAQLG